MVHGLDYVFGVSPSIGWAQECARAALILAYGLAVVRLVGRRVFGKWTALDIVVSIMVGSKHYAATALAKRTWRRRFGRQGLAIFRWPRRSHWNQAVKLPSSGRLRCTRSVQANITDLRHVNPPSAPPPPLAQAATKIPQPRLPARTPQSASGNDLPHR